MPKLKILSGGEVVKILRSFGFEILSQKGSHMKLVRLTRAGEKQTLIIPNHSEIDKGTSKAIFRQAIRYIPENDLIPHFYSN
ncbi:MAG TPA: type II toxin-antitoxin system HicA family toxin [Ignavibacteriaceae bacterium]|nr:type II toxin-antitoxin system HicA family toxin [Ignavibacteriaceae bacterium]